MINLFQIIYYQHPGIMIGIASLLSINSWFLIDAEPQTDKKASVPATFKQEKLKILSWNIAMLPFLELYYSRNERTKAIAAALLEEDYDIIVFQEAFSSVARRKIYKILCEMYPFQYGPANAWLGLKINSGLWILSKISLSFKREIKFSSSKGLDLFSRKGAILLEGSLNDLKFQIIGTHLVSDESDQSVREKQLREIYDNLIAAYSDPEIPQIICGDFNIDRSIKQNYRTMLDILDYVDGNLSGSTTVTFGFPYDTLNNESSTKPRQIDYILTRNTTGLNRINRRVVLTEDPVEILGYHLSDHFGIEAIVEFKNGRSSSKKDLSFYTRMF